MNIILVPMAVTMNAQRAGVWFIDSIDEGHGQGMNYIPVRFSDSFQSSHQFSHFHDQLNHSRTN